MENWKSIVGFEGFYEASNTGLIKSLSRTILCTHINGSLYSKTTKEKMIKPLLSKAGYYHLTLCKNGTQKQFYIHFIIADNFFIGPRPIIFQINHKDGNKLNNNDWNVEITTPSENIRHAHRIGLINRKRPHVGKLSNSDIAFIRNNKEISGAELGRKYSVTRGAIYSVRKFRTKKSYEQ